MLLQGTTLLVTLRCLSVRLSMAGLPRAILSNFFLQNFFSFFSKFFSPTIFIHPKFFSPTNFFSHFHFFMYFWIFYAILSAQIFFSPHFFFTQKFSSMSCGWSKAQHNATKHFSLIHAWRREEGLCEPQTLCTEVRCLDDPGWNTSSNWSLHLMTHG